MEPGQAGKCLGAGISLMHLSTGWVIPFPPHLTHTSLSRDSLDRRASLRPWDLLAYHRAWRSANCGSQAPGQMQGPVCLDGPHYLLEPRS